MSGPRVTSGEDSRQDYSTPLDLLSSVVERFGPIQFDLAAHSGNNRHERYFAPTEFVTKGTAKELDIDDEFRTLVDLAGKWVATVNLPQYVSFLKFDKKKKEPIFERRIPNVDPQAYALDAFKHSWADLSRKFKSPTGGPGLLWLNCEFNDVEPWSARCFEEMAKGANITLLTPLTMANWARDNILAYADVYFLSGRVCFDGKNVFPKDTMISHFHPDAQGQVSLWDWRSNTIISDGFMRPLNPKSLGLKQVL